MPGLDMAPGLPRHPRPAAERVEADLAAAGLELEGWLTDEHGWYALTLARAA